MAEGTSEIAVGNTPVVGGRELVDIHLAVHGQDAHDRHTFTVGSWDRSGRDENSTGFEPLQERDVLPESRVAEDRLAGCQRRSS